MNSNLGPLLEVIDLCVYFPVQKSNTKDGGKFVKAVDGVSLQVNQGETLGIVGESGSGKTTLGLAVVGLVRPTSGSVRINGSEVWSHDRKERKRLKGKLQIVFQDPSSSLDPRMKVKDIIAEPLRALGNTSESTITEKVGEVLAMVGLHKSDMFRFPHEFSGGQKQRISIARALVTNPLLIVLDEPTSSLDIAVQAEILNLLSRVQKASGVSYLFITHNIDVAQYMSDRIAVMYAGKLVELGRTEEVVRNPRHPYTVALLESVPRLHGDFIPVTGLPGEVPSPTNPPPGCRFNPRCKMSREICRIEVPPLRKFDEAHYSACHFAEEVTLQ